MACRFIHGIALYFIVLQAKNQVYLLTVLYVIFVNHSPSASLNPLALWMKSTGRYSVYQIVSLAVSSLDDPDAIRYGHSQLMP